MAESSITMPFQRAPISPRSLSQVPKLPPIRNLLDELLFQQIVGKLLPVDE